MVSEKSIKNLVKKFELFSKFLWEKFHWEKFHHTLFEVCLNKFEQTSDFLWSLLLEKSLQGRYGSI